MSKYDDPSYRDLCSIVDKMDAVIELYTKKFNDKIVFTILITNKEGKQLAKKSQFRNQTLDDMAKELMTNNTKWIQFDS